MTRDPHVPGTITPKTLHWSVFHLDPNRRVLQKDPIEYPAQPAFPFDLPGMVICKVLDWQSWAKVLHA